MSPKSQLMKPGQKALKSGQAEIVRNGKRTGVERTVTKDEPFPPPPRAGDLYLMVDETKH